LLFIFYYSFFKGEGGVYVLSEMCDCLPFTFSLPGFVVGGFELR